MLTFSEMIQLIIFLAMLGLACLVPAEAAEYAVAHSPAPVLNTPYFQDVFGGITGQTLKTDRCGQVRELEYIALPGTVFTVLKKLHVGRHEVYQVETNEYPAPQKIRLYVAGSFLKFESSQPSPRRVTRQSREIIIARLRESVGKPYVWGGNLLNGVPELTTWFYKGSSTEDEKRRRTLAGLDCSGLLYNATDGWTPRNTSQLTVFGQGVDIAGKQSVEIAAMLLPLDIMVWNGHVIIVLDAQTAIESRLECGKPGNGGVVITPLSQRLVDIMRTRRPVNTWNNNGKGVNAFVVRRWYPPL